METCFENRMVQSKLPKIGCLCVCKVVDSNGTGSIVELLEYGRIQGMIPASEVSRKRIYNISKVLNIGKILVGEVINIDTEKYYIDLSKKTVTDEEQQRTIHYYEKRKKVHSLLSRCAELDNLQRLDLYARYAWPWEQKYGTIDAAFKMIAQETLPCPQDCPSLVNCCKHAFRNKPVMVSAKVEITCFGPLGIDGIKSVLNRVKQEYSININLITSPLFLFHKMTTDELETIPVLNEASEKAIQWISDIEGGSGSIKEIAKIKQNDLQSEIDMELNKQAISESESCEDEFE